MQINVFQDDANHGKMPLKSDEPKALDGPYGIGSLHNFKLNCVMVITNY